MNRVCPSGREVLPLSAFGRNRTLPDGLSFPCRACSRQRSNRWYRDRRQSVGQDVRDHSRVPVGFRWCPTCRQAVEDYTVNARTASGFGDRCAICDDSSPQHLDHDHETGRIRQLLSQRCHHALGLFRDDPRFLRAAAEYGERHRARQAAAWEGGAGSRPGTPARPRTPPVGSAQRRNGRSGTARRGGYTSTDSRQQAAGEADA